MNSTRLFAIPCAPATTCPDARYSVPPPKSRTAPPASVIRSDRGGAGASDPLRGVVEILEDPEVDLHEALLTDGEAGRKERARKILATRDLKPRTIEKGPFPSNRSEQLLAEWIVDDSRDDVVSGGPSRARPGRRHRDREDRKPVDEVGRAVERVDDPADGAAGIGGGRLLGEDAVVGVTGADRLHHRRLGFPVHGGDEVVLALQRVRDRAAGAVRLHHDRGAGARRLDRGLQKILMLAHAAAPRRIRVTPADATCCRSSASARC